MAPLIAALVSAGLPLFANAVLAKGKEMVEEKVGVKLPDLKMGESLPADAVVALKQVEAAKEVELVRLANEERRIEVEDRNGARQREMAVKDWVPAALAMSVTAGFFGVLAYMLNFGTPAVGGEALLVMLGSLGTAWGAVMNYYFGSSKSSADKNVLFQRR